MENLIIVAVLLVIVGLAAWYVYKSKKSGRKCIGCPYADCCASQKGEGSACRGSGKNG